MIANRLLSSALRKSRGIEHPARRLTGVFGSVSVVIPCYRYGQYLPDANRAANDQPGLDVEVIIVDDCSPDDSGDIASDLASQYSNVKVIRHTKNCGHIETYNDGLEAATREYVALVSADDLLAPGALTRSAALMSCHPNVGFVYGRAVRFERAVPTPHIHTKSWIVWPGLKWLAWRCYSGHNAIASPEVVMRNSVLKKIGGYHTGLPHTGDFEMWMRAATVSDVGYVRGPDQAYYRQHDSNMHRSIFRSGLTEGRLIDLRQRWAAFDTVLSSQRPTGAAEMEAAARQTLAIEAVQIARRAQRRGRFEESHAAILEFAKLMDFETVVKGELPYRRIPRRLAAAIAVAGGGWSKAVTKFERWRLDEVGI